MYLAKRRAAPQLRSRVPARFYSPLFGLPRNENVRLGLIEPMGDVGAGAGFTPAVEQWRDLVSKFAGDLPVEFLLAWISRESGGNPCSYTSLHESGIFQLEPPENTQQGGTTEAALRAACSGSSQKVARQLTSDELDEQVRSGIQYVNYLRGVAHKKLDAAGVTWDETTPDFWQFVKLQHAYPGPTAAWLAASTIQLGHPPASWAEFRSTTTSQRQDVQDNAEWVGAYGAGGGSALGGTTGTLIAVGAAGLLSYLLWRRRRRK